MPNLLNSKFTTGAVTVSATSGSGSANVLYTCPGNYSAIVRFLHVSNGTASSKKIYIQRFDASASAYSFIVNGLSMSANTTHDVVSGSFFTLPAGDKVVCYMESGATMDVTISVEEYYDPARIS